jgi:arylsulfatase A
LCKAFRALCGCGSDCRPVRTSHGAGLGCHLKSACSDNAPQRFRRVRIPFIARWSGRIAAGSSSECTINLTDLFATSAEIVDRDLPSDAAEDSISLLPVLLGKKDHITERDAVLIQGNGKDSAIAVCTGKWKLIVRYGSDRGKGHELYDLSNDPGELTELSNQEPEVTKRLAAVLEKAEAEERTRR